MSLVRVIIILAAVAVGYFVFSAVGDTLLSHKLTQDEQQLHQQIDRLSQQQKQLQAVREYLKTDEYVEGVASRVLGLVRRGQALYIVKSNAQPTPGSTGAAPNATPAPWWERLYHR